jgi:hypothetical protein
MIRWCWNGAYFAWLGVVLVCCGGPTFVVQQYSGPQRARESIAVIRVNGGGPRLTTLDDESLVVPERGTRFHIEVLPGVHELQVDDPNVGLYASRVRFVAEAGKVYRIVVRPALTGQPNAQAFEVDRASDAEVRPVALVVDAPPPVPAPLPPPAPSVSPDAGAVDATRDGS